LIDTPPKPESNSAVIGKRSLRFALFLLPLVALANIGFFFWSVEDRNILAVAQMPHWLLLALIFSFLPWLTNSLRLMIWSRFFEVGLRWKQVFRIILGTVLGNAVTPTATGAVAVKWAFLVNEDVTPDKATTLIGLQTAEDSLVSMALLALALVIAVTLELPQFLSEINWIEPVLVILRKIAVVVGIILAVAVIILAAVQAGLFGKAGQKLGRRLSDRVRRMFFRAAKDWRHALRSGRKYLLASIMLAVLQWTTRHSIAVLVIGFYGDRMMPVLHWALQWLVITASSVIPTPGGAVGTEASFLLLFSPFVADTLLGPVMVTWRATMFYIPVMAAGLIFMVLGWRNPVAKKPAI